jgi:hypothetical protein
VKNAQGNVVLGRTHWKRFAAVVVPTTAAAGALTLMMANGALAASFAVSGQSFKLRADKLVGTGFEQIPGLDHQSNGTLHPVSVSIIGHADVTNLCQSVAVPAPFLGSVTLTLKASGPVTAENLVVDAETLSGNAEFKNIVIGQDSGTLDAIKGYDEPAEVNGLFGQQAESVTINDLRQTAWATTAGTFKLDGLNLSLKVKGDGCF